MISYREKEMMMVMKYIADHSDEFADQIMEAKDKMGAEENLNSLFNRLPDISDYAALVDYVKSCGYDTTLRINDLLSKEELNQLEKEYAEIENDFKEKYEKSISACSRRAHDRFHVRLQLGKEGSHR